MPAPEHSTGAKLFKEGVFDLEELEVHLDQVLLDYAAAKGVVAHTKAVGQEVANHIKVPCKELGLQLFLIVSVNGSLQVALEWSEHSKKGRRETKSVGSAISDFDIVAALFTINNFT